MLCSIGSQTSLSYGYSKCDVAIAIQKSIAETRAILHQEQILLQNITDSGLEVRSVDIPADGNCLFHAISDQLQRVKETPRTHSDLRAMAVEALKVPSTLGVGCKLIYALTINLCYYIYKHFPFLAKA